MASNSIPVFDPTGKVRMIPADQLQAALRAGGQQAVKMSDPQGKMRWIPQEQAAAAQREGGKLVDSPATAPTLMQRILGRDTTSPLDAALAVGKNVVSHAAGAITAPFHAALDQPQSAEETAASMYGPGGLTAYRMLAEPTVNALRDAYHLHEAGGPQASLTAGSTYDAQGNNIPTAGSKLIDAIPVYGAWARNAENEAQTKGILPAAAGVLTDAAVPEVAGGLVPAVAGRMRPVRDWPALMKERAAGVVAPQDALSSPLPADPRVSMREHYNEAKDIGVDLDAAQATGARVPKIGKAVSQYSTLGKGTFEKAQAGNINALHIEADNMLDRIDPQPMSREEFGNFVREKLAEDLNARYTYANDVFDDLSKRGTQQPNMSAVRDQARQILADNQDYYQKHPQLLKGGAGQAWSIIKNLADQEPGATPDTWSDLQRLRSDLMDQYRSPDIVGSRAEGWLKQLSGRVDESMTGAASGLSPNDTALFRGANDAWAQMKDTYDNPQSPFYSILRAKEGTTAANTITNLKPQAMRTLQDVADRTGTPELVTQAQRQRVDRILSPQGNDVPDLRNLPQRVKNLDKEQLNRVLAPNQVSDLDRLARVSQTVHADANPSGTLKGAQMPAEVSVAAGALAHGNVAPAAVMVGQGLAAKALTSPGLTDALVNRTAPPPKPTPTPSTPVPAAVSVPAGVAAENAQKQEEETAGDPNSFILGSDGSLTMVGPDGQPAGAAPPATAGAAGTPNGDGASTLTHPLGAVTGIDHDTGLPIVKRTDPAPVLPPVTPQPSAEAAPPASPSVPPAATTTEASLSPAATPPPAAVEEEPTPDTHIFSLSAWQAENPTGNPNEATQAATDAGYEVQG